MYSRHDLMRYGNKMWVETWRSSIHPSYFIYQKPWREDRWTRRKCLKKAAIALSKYLVSSIFKRTKTKVHLFQDVLDESSIILFFCQKLPRKLSEQSRMSIWKDWLNVKESLWLHKVETESLCVFCAKFLI